MINNFKGKNMDVVTTSLEALIQRATNPQNEKPDIAAMEAFCVMLGKESKGVHIANRLLATQIQATNEKEALQALTLLDTCMKRCGRSFHTEVGKFRFLNVMIKLVSPKYLGDKTPPSVRQKILELLYAWIKDYPREVKIKETYEMLKKQGVVKDEVSPVRNIVEDVNKPTKVKNPIFEDEEKTKLLQELLQSKDPFDLKLANKLIKTMVKDDEKRAQLNSQRNMELESVHNNVKLLSEMLDSYDAGKSSTEDVELMKELHDACERLKPTITRLANESQDNDEMLGEVLAANDELSRVFDKYTSVIILGRSSRGDSIANNAPSLLDLSSPSDLIDPCSNINKKSDDLDSTKTKTDMEMLGDIFSSIGNPLNASSSSHDTGLLMSDTNIMQPISILPIVKAKELQSSTSTTVQLDSKAKALEDLNELGESLLKQSLSQVTNVPKNNVSKLTKGISEVPEKSIGSVAHSRPAPIASILETKLTKDLQTKNDASQAANGLREKSFKTTNENQSESIDLGDLLNDDDAMLDVSSSMSTHIGEDQTTNVNKHKPEMITTLPANSDTEIKPLTDIHVTIDNIKPGSIPPLTVIEEKNGISVVLHFAKGSPRPDVTVIVVTTMSKNSKALSNYLFQAVVPKKCKCRLQAPSGTELPPHNPFLPPSAITQIMLIANPQKDPLSLKFMLSYTMEDETFTEMGEVDKLPAI